MIYLASPYSDPDPEIREARYRAALACTRALVSRWHRVLSPIVLSHVLVADGGLQSDWETWRDYDLDLLARCDELWVLCLPGWQRSVGVCSEVRAAREQGMPISLILPPDVFDTIDGAFLRVPIGRTQAWT